MKKTLILLFLIFFNLITFAQEKCNWIWYPGDFEIWVHTEENEIEIRVANTLAPHYTLPEKTLNLGPAKSGLVSPANL